MGILVFFAAIIVIVILINVFSPKHKKTPDRDYYSKAVDQMKGLSFKKPSHTEANLRFIKSDNETGDFLVIDCETTGLPKSRNASIYTLNNWPRILQLAWMVLDNDGRYLKRENFYIKTGDPIPPEATEINHITSEIIEEKGVHPIIALLALRNHLKIVHTVVAHNVDFDIPIIESEFIRFGFGPQILAKNKICTMESSVNYLKLRSSNNYSRYKFPKLSELYGFLFFSNSNVEIENLHDASVDVDITASCFFELRKVYNVKIIKRSKTFIPSDITPILPSDVVIPDKRKFPAVPNELKQNTDFIIAYSALRDEYNSTYNKLYKAKGLNTLFGINRLQQEEILKNVSIKIDEFIKQNFNKT